MHYFDRERPLEFWSTTVPPNTPFRPPYPICMVQRWSRHHLFHLKISYFRRFWSRNRLEGVTAGEQIQSKSIGYEITVALYAISAASCGIRALQTATVAHWSQLKNRSHLTGTESLQFGFPVSSGLYRGANVRRKV